MISSGTTRTVTFSIHMRFHPAVMDQAVQMLVAAVEPTEAVLACRNCSVARDAAEEGVVHYNEAWDSEAAFRQHVQSEGFRRVLAAMDMCCEEPRVVVGHLSGRSGIAHLRTLLEQQNGDSINSAGNEA